MTKEEKIKRLEEHSKEGTEVWFTPRGKGSRECLGVIRGEAYIITGRDSNDPYRHVIQRIERKDGSEVIYRTGYYLFGGKSGDKLRWGQYTQCLEESDYKKLLAEARRKDWPIF